MSRKKKRSLHHHIKHGAAVAGHGLRKTREAAHSFARAGVLAAGFLFGAIILSAAAALLKYNSLFSKVDGKIFQVVGARSTGTGFQVRNPKTGKVFFITNHHVCADTDGKTVYIDMNNTGSLVGEERLVGLKILKQNAPNDMCIAEGIKGVKPLETNTDPRGSLFMIDGYGYGIKDVSLGRFIKKFTRKFPLGPIANSSTERSFWAGYGIPSLTSKECKGDGYSRGTVDTGTFGTVPVCFATQTSLMGTMKAFPGNSGSPVVNLSGEVVSLVWGAMMPLNTSLSIPIKKFIELSSDL